MLRGHSAIAMLRLCFALILLPSCCLDLRALRFEVVSAVAAKGSIHSGASIIPEMLMGIGLVCVYGGGGGAGGKGSTRRLCHQA